VLVRVRVPAGLRDLVAGEAEIAVTLDTDSETVTVAAVLDALAERHQALERRIRDERGRPRRHVNLFVGSDNIRDRDGLDTAMPAGSELTVLPAVSGG
jgi:molybdopterin synthase sulfur carrier subunit